MIPDVIQDAILHGFGALRRGSIRPWERVVGIQSIMSKRQPRSLPGSSRILKTGSWRKPNDPVYCVQTGG